METKQPTLEETKEAYLSEYGAQCPDEVAQRLLQDFVEYRGWADKLPERKYVISPKTIREYIAHEKMREESAKEHEEYERKLSEMSPKERWLHLEGFDNPLGRWVEAFLDTESGNKVFDSVSSLWNAASESNLRMVVDGLYEYAQKGLPPDVQAIPNPDEFMATKEAEHILGWFVGICNDGSRACRTIHICARAFFAHDWKTFQVLATKE